MLLPEKFKTRRDDLMEKLMMVGKNLQLLGSSRVGVGESFLFLDLNFRCFVPCVGSVLVCNLLSLMVVLFLSVVCHSRGFPLTVVGFCFGFIKAGLFEPAFSQKSHFPQKKLPS